MEIESAFILAAGYGRRLSPITDHIPKPLLPVCGRPMLQIVLDRVADLAPRQLLINAHHKADMIEQWVSDNVTNCNIRILFEEAILGTGGALMNAAPLLGDAPFLVHNADILAHIDLRALLAAHSASGNIATLAVHDFPRFNNLLLDREGQLRDLLRGGQVPEAGLTRKAFMGIAVYSAAIRAYLPPGSSSIVDGWLKAIAGGETVGSHDFSGTLWIDIGTPEGYASAVIETLRQDGETVFIHDEADCGCAQLEGYVALEKSVRLVSPVRISNSIILPGAQLGDEPLIEDAIKGPGFSLSIGGAVSRVLVRPSPPLSAWLGSGSEATEAVALGAGGSDRHYYRIESRAKAVVLMQCSETDQDYPRHMANTDFFLNCGLPVPALYAADHESRQALFEDLGDCSLYSWLKCRRKPEAEEALYRQVLAMTVRLQTSAFDRIAENPLLGQRLFDCDHFRWETNYFLERFVRGLRGQEHIDPAAEQELDCLAALAASFPRTVVHRDFQSQNIMIDHAGLPRLIDYQGARLGPAAYDIASMLWDPYYRLDDALRQRLLAYFIGTMKQAAPHFDEELFVRSLLPCRLQRHMQALGAYGFLSIRKGKRYFLKHVPQAIWYLKEEAALAREDYPALYALVEAL